MGTTPIYSFPFPDDTDLVLQAPQQFENLAVAVEGTVDQLQDDLDTVEANSKLASNVTSGTFAVDRIPTLPGSKIANGFTYAGTRVFTATGTFSKANPLGTGDIGLRAIYVRMAGGGGGGGGAQRGVGDVGGEGGGGGAGAYAELFRLESALSASETVTVGTGGAGGAAANTGRADDGVATVAFGVTCNGGQGGQGSEPGLHGGQTNFGSRGSGGTASGSVLFATRGGDGGNGRVVQGAGGQAIGIGTNFGGSNPLGNTPTTPRNDPGRVGRGFGAGGSGGTASTTNKVGGPGAPGVVIVDCFV